MPCNNLDLWLWNYWPTHKANHDIPIIYLYLPCIHVYIIYRHIVLKCHYTQYILPVSIPPSFWPRNSHLFFSRKPPHPTAERHRRPPNAAERRRSERGRRRQLAELRPLRRGLRWSADLLTEGHRRPWPRRWEVYAGNDGNNDVR